MSSLKAPHRMPPSNPRYSAYDWREEQRSVSAAQLGTMSIPSRRRGHDLLPKRSQADVGRLPTTTQQQGSQKGPPGAARPGGLMTHTPS